MIGLGRLDGETERSDDAVGRLQAARGNGGDYPDVHVMLGELYQAGGRTDEARSEYRRALTLNKGYSRARRALAELATA